VSRDIVLSYRFRQVVRQYPKPVRIEIGKAIDLVQLSLGSPHRHTGLGIRKLMKDYFEMRVGLELRLIFRIKPESVTFVFAGKHEEVRRFLKQL